jgi:hypothetical protein
LRQREQCEQRRADDSFGTAVVSASAEAPTSALLLCGKQHADLRRIELSLAGETYSRCPKGLIGLA